MEEMHQPKVSHRWILDIPGIPPFLVQKIEQLPGSQLMVTTCWLANQTWPCEPTALRGVLKLIDAEGVVTDTFDLEFADWETLALCFDYGKNAPASPKVLLKGFSAVRRE